MDGLNMERIKAPTVEELQILMQDIQDRRTALMDKYGLFGGGEMVNLQMDVLNKSYDKLELQLDKLNSI